MTRRRIAVLAIALLLRAGAATAQGTTEVLVDRDETVGAGAAVSVAAGTALARLEDHFVPVRLFDEHGAARRAGNIAYRFLKIGAFDLPQERFIQVANHEVFGHGGRLRERFDGPIGYSVDVPRPYGRGGGETSFDFRREPTAYELLAITAGGMEADGVSAAIAFRHAVEARTITPRDSMRYLSFELDTFRYIRLTGDGPQERGEDVADWLSVYNHVAAGTAAGALTARTLRREVLVSLANPMLAYAAFGIGRYLWNGAGDVHVPMIRFGSLRYVPMLRYRLAPYGTEVSVVNELVRRSTLTEVTARFGRSPRSTPWGIGVLRNDVVEWRRWRVNAGASLWRQPALVGEPLDIDPSRSRLGMEARGSAERPLIPVWFGTGRAAIVVDLAVKSRGYVAGEPLSGGVNLRVGLGLPL